MITAILVCTLLMKDAATQSVTVTLGTSYPKFGSNLTLICTVSSGCCSSFPRVWQTGAGTNIITNGVSTDSSKYGEEYDGGTSGFKLIIKNLQISDIGKSFQCLYGLQTSLYTITQDASFEYFENSGCPFKEKQGQIFAGQIKLSRAAPNPSFTATYGGVDWTALLSIKRTIYDTWFYNIDLSIDTTKSTCGDDAKDEKFTLIMKTGTTNTILCDELNLCNAVECGLKDWGYSLILSGLIFLEVVLIVFCWNKLHKGDIKKEELHGKTLILVLLCTFGTLLLVAAVCLIIALPIGIRVVNCLSGTDPAFIVLGLLGFGIPVMVSVCIYKTLKVSDDESIQSILLFILLGVLTFGLYYVARKKEHPHNRPGDNVALSEGTSSSNSGLFSCASCKVDQEPVNPSKNSAQPKGKTTKTPTNEKDKKQVAVVKPEVNTKHIKTENREKETSFDDDKDFESKLNKVPQGRLLPVPQLSETSTPRALSKPDALPPIADRRRSERDDLDETAPEKKKNKKKKKRQDDDEL